MANKKKTQVVEAAPAAIAVAELPVEAPKAPSAPPPLTASQQAEIDRIMAEAKAKAESVILGGSSVAALGTPSGNVEETQDRYQRDSLPGKFRKDKTYIPEFIYDEDDNVTRRVLLHSEYKYALVPEDPLSGNPDFLTYTGMGYKFCKYDGGNQSGLDGKGFRGTGEAIVTRQLNGNCRRGDCMLMWIPIRGWEALAAEDREKAQGAEKRALGVFHNAAYSQGIRPFAEVADVEGGDRQQIF